METTRERLARAVKLFNERTDLELATREIFGARLDSINILLAERDAMNNKLLVSYRSSGVMPDDDKLETIIQAAYRLEAIETSLNFMFDMIGGIE